MARKYFERRSLRNELSTYLTGLGWSDVTYREGFQNEETVSIPSVAVHFLPGNNKAFQIGDTGERLFKRVVQIDCYMETEHRADAIADDIMDFFDLESVDIINNVSANLGALVCQDTESIYSDTMRPIMENPKLLRWRSIVRATLEAHYY